MVLRTTVCKPDQSYLGSYDFKRANNHLINGFTQPLTMSENCFIFSEKWPKTTPFCKCDHNCTHFYCSKTESPFVFLITFVK